MARLISDNLFQRIISALCNTSESAKAVCDLLMAEKIESKDNAAHQGGEALDGEESNE